MNENGLSDVFTGKLYGGVSRVGGQVAARRRMNASNQYFLRAGPVEEIGLYRGGSCCFCWAYRSKKKFWFNLRLI